MADIRLGHHDFGYNYEDGDDDETYTEDFFDDDGGDDNYDNDNFDDDDDEEEDEGEEEIGLYLCHQCHSKVRPPSLSPLLCPICHGGFLEEIRQPSLSESMHDYLDGLVQIFDDISTLLSRSRISVQRSQRNPISYLQNRMQSIFNTQWDDEGDHLFGSENVRPAETSPRFRPEYDSVSQNEIQMRNAFDNDESIDSRFRQQGRISENRRPSTSSTFQQQNRVSQSEHQTSLAFRQEDPVPLNDLQSTSSTLQQQNHVSQSEHQTSLGFRQEDNVSQPEQRSGSASRQEEPPMHINNHQLSSVFQQQVPQTEHQLNSRFRQHDSAPQNDHQSSNRVLQQQNHHHSSSVVQQQNPVPQNNPPQSTPASVLAVRQLPTLHITQQHLAIDASALCAICKDEFLLNVEVKQMPCNHLYHPGCILPWLAEHNSCPVCRHLLPTDSNPQHILPTTNRGASSNANAAIHDTQDSLNRDTRTHRGPSNSMNQSSRDTSDTSDSHVVSLSTSVPASGSINTSNSMSQRPFNTSRRTQQGHLNATRHGSMNTSNSMASRGQRSGRAIPNASTLGCPTCPNTDSDTSRQIPQSWPGSSSNGQEFVAQIHNASVCGSPYPQMSRAPEVCNNRPAYIPTEDAVVQRPFPTAPPLSDILPSSSPNNINSRVTVRHRRNQPSRLSAEHRFETQGNYRTVS